VPAWGPRLRVTEKRLQMSREGRAAAFVGEQNRTKTDSQRTSAEGAPEKRE